MMMLVEKAVILAVCVSVGDVAAFSPSTTIHGSRRTKNVAFFAHHHRQSRSLSSVVGSTTRLYQADESTNEVATSDAEDEWNPENPASTTPQLLSAVWDLIAQGSSMTKGDTSTMLFPNMQDQLTKPSYLNRILAHFDVCKDVCDHFGIHTLLVPYQQPSGSGPIKGFTVKSFRKADQQQLDDDYEFEYDPFWDDGAADFDYSGIDDEMDEKEGKDKKKKEINFPEIVNRIPDDDQVIIDTTKVWVGKLMSDMGICPFTRSAEMAGLPMGQVLYTIERCTSMEEMYARYWKEVVRVEQSNEKELSTTLLIAPEFCMDNIDIFESYANTLTQALTGLDGMDDLLQLIFFHPYWTFRDGGDRSGEGMAANYARRSPWPMINLLRTTQVRSAQKGIPTGLVYKQNEKTLRGIGYEKLETMLRLRDWDPIADVKVDRRVMEALRVAQDYQQTGQIRKEDMSFESDATPIANKVNEAQMQQGNLVNVLKQALEKRLGKADGSGVVAQLSGPETSATAMAADFLLAELEKIAAAPPKKPAKTQASMWVEEEDDDFAERSNQEMDVLFGGQGILQDTNTEPDIDLMDRINMF
eukprot:CAMPEP_0194036060 /NCGR_PEP_ID=MMETSP0009_2-20130614/8454_1 /TAXON_ID=210454 /ORGANISM="Grammatophora oceanica, Strain CCMP 410" /LENGTH=584 /DNA_ID=CAMNT_0038677663 /DNA_START=108 /DNA_END=1862 /DNA_ORIENTATION=-